MRAFIKKYYEAVIYLLQLPYNTRRIKNIEQQNTVLRENKASDIERWQVKKELNENWNERTSILGDLVNPGASIIEFGAGAMFLKGYLKNYRSYAPSDIIKRYEETLVCDLNKVIGIDLSAYDTAIFSGVLEYVYDVDGIFEQLRSGINCIILSYCCSDVMHVSREKNGWLSDYTKEQIEAIFKKYGFTVAHYREWNRQSIYKLIKQP